jgi:hypothetical protein
MENEAKNLLIFILNDLANCCSAWEEKPNVYDDIRNLRKLLFKDEAIKITIDANCGYRVDMENDHYWGGEWYKEGTKEFDFNSWELDKNDCFGILIYPDEKRESSVVITLSNGEVIKGEVNESLSAKIKAEEGLKISIECK